MADPVVVEPPVVAAPTLVEPKPGAAPAPAPVVDPKAAEPPKTEPPKSAWPEDWRTHMDTEGKHAKTLERYASPKALADALFAAQNKIRSGELKANVPFPDKGTAEEQVAWRKENGIPEAPEKYDLGKLKVDENSKPLVDDFLKVAHTKNLSPAAATAALEFYFERVAKSGEERSRLDIQYKEEAENELRAEWGSDFKVNRNLAKTLIDTAPENVRDDISQARLPNGRPLLSHASALRWLVGLSRSLNPAATVMGGEKGDAAGLENEIAAIEKTMGTPAYTKDEKIQARLRDLYRARDAVAEQSKKK